MTDISRDTTGVNLPESVSNEIWANAQEASAVMRLSRQIILPGGGVTVPMVTADAEAGWVNEGDEKPVDDATVANKSITPYKLAVIEVFSNEFKRDLGGLYAELARRLPNALAAKFDATVFHGTAPGSNFDILSDAAAVAVGGTDVLADLLVVRGDIADANGVMNGIVLSPAGTNVLLGATDGFGRPLLVPDTSSAALGRVLGADVVESRAAGAAGTPATYGFAGDWSAAVYGTVEGIQVSVSDQATVNKGGTQLNLWQRNMFALRAEVEIGFAVADKARFVRLTAAA